MQISDLAQWVHGIADPSVAPLLATLRHVLDSFVDPNGFDDSLRDEVEKKLPFYRKQRDDVAVHRQRDAVFHATDLGARQRRALTLILRTFRMAEDAPLRAQILELLAKLRRARRVGARGSGRGAVAREHRLGLRQHRPRRPRVDLEQHLPLPHLVALGEDQ